MVVDYKIVEGEPADGPQLAAIIIVRVALSGRGCAWNPRKTPHSGFPTDYNSYAGEE